MPGSPVEVKIQSRSSPPNMPPLPPVNPGGPRPVSFTPAARKGMLGVPREQLWVGGKALLMELTGMSQPSARARRVMQPGREGGGDRGCAAVL